MILNKQSPNRRKIFTAVSYLKLFNKPCETNTAFTILLILIVINKVYKTPYSASNAHFNGQLLESRDLTTERGLLACVGSVLQANRK